MPDDYYTKADFADELDLDESAYDELPDDETIDRVVSNVEGRNVAVSVFDAAEPAREYLAELISNGDTVQNGHSTTLEEIGFTDVLTDADGFEHVGNEIADTEDDEERFEARRRAVTADVFFDGVNAIAESGELLGANALGNGVGAWAFGAKRLVLVSGTNKIVPTWDDALDRVREFALPLEDERAQEVYGQGSTVGKLVSLEHERVDDRTELVLLDQRRGF